MDGYHYQAMSQMVHAMITVFRKNQEIVIATTELAYITVLSGAYVRFFCILIISYLSLQRTFTFMELVEKSSEEGVICKIILITAQEIITD